MRIEPSQYERRKQNRMHHTTGFPYTQVPGFRIAVSGSERDLHGSRRHRAGISSCCEVGVKPQRLHSPPRGGSRTARATPRPSANLGSFYRERVAGTRFWAKSRGVRDQRSRVFVPKPIGSPARRAAAEFASGHCRTEMPMANDGKSPYEIPSVTRPSRSARTRAKGKAMRATVAMEKPAWPRSGHPSSYPKSSLAQMNSSAEVAFSVFADLQDVLATLRTMALFARSFRTKLSIELFGTDRVLIEPHDDEHESSARKALHAVQARLRETTSSEARAFVLEIDLVAASFFTIDSITVRLRHRSPARRNGHRDRL